MDTVLKTVSTIQVPGSISGCRRRTEMLPDEGAAGLWIRYLKQYPQSRCPEVFQDAVGVRKCFQMKGQRDCGYGT